MTVLAAETSRWRELAATLCPVPAALRRVLTDIDEIETACLDDAVEPSFRSDGGASENLLTIRIHHWRRRVAEADGLPLPPDPLAPVTARIARRAAAYVRLDRLRDRVEARREREVEARREMRRTIRAAARKARPAKAKLAAKPKGVAPDPRQGVLF